MQGIIDTPVAARRSDKSKTYPQCYHCGLSCTTESISIADKFFCCEGCKLVYEVINDSGLCDYYKLQTHPGLGQVKAIRSDKYAYLDNEEIAKQLYQFSNGDHTIVVCYIPAVHCSSCMWLLEHLGRLDSGIGESRLNFSAKEVTIHFSQKRVSLRNVVELMTTIGYEPYITLDDAGKQKAKTYNKQRIFKLGVAGFCFGNIMMMSFPEYLSGRNGIEEQYAHLFRYLNLGLSLPVFFYSASEFFVTAWKGLKQRTLNIDAPIALAIIITFVRSIYEIAGNTGSGYLDSMSGIVFFMLAGRILQERTYKSLSFTRDYRSYFPIAMSVVLPTGIVTRKLSDLNAKDIVLLHNDEIVPADAIVRSGVARIDYSFVTGESEPVDVKLNEMVYAGGKQVGGQLTIEIIKPVAGSYLTSLWNHYAFSRNKGEENDRQSAIHVLSKYFTYLLFTLAIATGIYWLYADPARIVSSVSAMLIVACPCALLLSATFTNGNIIRILSLNGLYLRDPSVIEQLGNIDHIVFDKTGTITQSMSDQFTQSGHELTEAEKDLVYAIVKNSRHPNSKVLARWLGERPDVSVQSWQELPGKGLQAFAGKRMIMIGSAEFTGAPAADKDGKLPTLYVRIDESLTAFYLQSVFRNDVPGTITQLARRYTLSVLSGDNSRQRSLLAGLFGHGDLLFGQQPLDKLRYIERLQHGGKHVMMVGDGLNDAGALQQSNVGITLADDINNFTPSCDAILDAKKINLMPAVLELARSARGVIRASFVVSVCYNLAGLYFAVQGKLNPMTAAILMPCSTLSIVIITSGYSSYKAWRAGLAIRSES